MGQYASHIISFREPDCRYQITPYVEWKSVPSFDIAEFSINNAKSMVSHKGLQIPFDTKKDEKIRQMFWEQFLCGTKDHSALPWYCLSNVCASKCTCCNALKWWTYTKMDTIQRLTPMKSFTKFSHTIGNSNFNDTRGSETINTNALKMLSLHLCASCTKNWNPKLMIVRDKMLETFYPSAFWNHVATSPFRFWDFAPELHSLFRSLRSRFQS